MLQLDTLLVKTICFAQLDSYTVNKSGPAMPRVPKVVQLLPDQVTVYAALEQAFEKMYRDCILPHLK